MAIPKDFKKNFETLLAAAKNGDLALLECKDAKTKEPRYVVCAVGFDSGQYVMTPFGHMAEGNPFDAYLPPEA